MRKTARVAILALASVAGLAFSATALAAYTPKFVVLHENMVTGSGGPLSFRVAHERSDDATAKAVVYIPQGYGVRVGQSVGVDLGEATAQAITSTGARVPLTGSVFVENPAQHTTNTCAPGEHAAVWALTLRRTDTTLKIPIYVDLVSSGPEAAFAKAKLTWCPPSPHVPIAQGGAPLGAKLTFTQFRIRNVFTNPAGRGQYVFRSAWTPYTAGTATANTAATVEARSFARLGAQLALNAVVDGKGYVTIRGFLNEFTVGLSGIPVKLKMGPTARGVKIFKTVRTNRNGNFGHQLRLAKKPTTRWFRGAVFVPVRIYTKPGCGTAFGPAVAPTCVSALLPSYTLESRRAVRVVYR